MPGAGSALAPLSVGEAPVSAGEDDVTHVAPNEFGRALPEATVERSGQTVTSEADCACPQVLESGFSFTSKMRVPLACFAQYFTLSSFVYIPNIYISLFRGNATLIGATNMAMVLFDIVLHPYIGQLSDAGFFNRWVFRDVCSWGRRAPLMLLSIPVCMLSCALTWIGPEKLQTPLAVALWYAVLRFLLTLGMSMFETAFQAGFTELFPSKAERINIGLAKLFVTLIAGSLGSAGVAPTALGVTDPGTPHQRQLFALFAILTGSSWMLAVPYACLQRRSIMTRIVRSASLWGSMREFWHASPAFRCWAASTHLYNASVLLILTGLPFYCEVVLNYTAEQVEMAMRIVILGAAIMIPLSMPLVAYMTNHLSPPKLTGVSGLLCILVAPCHVHALHGIPGQFWPQVVQVLIICGAGVGVLSVSWESAQSALFTQIVDEDQVRRAETQGASCAAAKSHNRIPERRDGMINSFRTSFSISAGAWAGLFHLLLGALGYDSARSKDNTGEPQPHEVRIMLELLFVFVVPAMFAIFAISMFRFPLQGERLDALASSYARMYDRLVRGAEAVKGSSAGSPRDGARETGHAVPDLIVSL